MSKFNILEFHKNMKSSLKGAVEKAEQRSAEAKQRLRDIKQLEADMLKRLEAKREKESEAVAEQPATVQEPVVKQPAVKTEKPAAEVVKPEQPVKVKVEEKKAEEKPVQKQESKEKDTMKTPVKEKTEKANTKPQEKKAEAPKPVEPKSDFSVYMPDLSVFKPRIRVVRSAKDEEAEQKKREEKQRQERERAAAVAPARPQRQERGDRPQGERRGERRGPGGQQGGYQKRGAAGGQGFQKDGGFGGKFDKDEDAPTNNNVRKPAPRKNSGATAVFVAPQTRDRHVNNNNYDQKKRASEEEMAAKRRRNAMKEKSFMNGDDDGYVRSARKGKRKDDKKMSAAIEPIKIVFDILGYLCVGLTLMFGFFMFRAFQLKKKLGNLQCPKCQTIINGDNVTFVVKSCNFRITENKSQNPKAGMDLIMHGFEHTTVEITCKCQECGTDKTFTECFKTVDVEISRKGVSALNADLILSQMRADLEIAQKSGFEGVSGDYKFKTKKTAEQMVKDYFADDGTASKIGNTTVTASKK